jgi:hypothetical protein
MTGKDKIECLLATLIIGTYCSIVIISGILVIKDKISLEVFLALLSGFTGQAMYVIKKFLDGVKKESA